MPKSFNIQHLTLNITTVAFCIFLFACSSSKKGVSTGSEPRSLPALPASQINIPVKIYMKPLLAKMDSMTSKEFTSEKWPDFIQSSCDFRYKYRFIRSPFVFNCRNNQVDISFRGYYQIAGSKTVCAFDKQISPWVSGSCGFSGESLRRVDLNINSVLQLLPNHQVRTTTRLNKIRPIDKCQVSLLQTDITKEIMDSIRSSIETYCSSFDKFVHDLNNSAQLMNWRNQRSRVMPISSYGFLNLNPLLFRVGGFNYANDTLSFSVGFNGKPEFSSDSLRIVTNTMLPPVNTSDAPNGVSTYLNAVYDYTYFTQMLNDSLRNRPIDIEGRTFVIKDINMSGTNEGKIQLALTFSGAKSGTVRLSGTPVLDTARQVLSMPDISFSIESRDILLNMAEGLFRKKIMRKLKDQSVLDIAALIERNKQVISARLNQTVNEWMSTKGELQELRLIGLLPQKDHLQIQIYIKANIALVGHPPAAALSLD
jgi:hypothetical protein